MDYLKFLKCLTAFGISPVEYSSVEHEITKISKYNFIPMCFTYQTDEGDILNQYFKQYFKMMMSDEAVLIDVLGKVSRHNTAYQSEADLTINIINDSSIVEMVAISAKTPIQAGHLMQKFKLFYHRNVVYKYHADLIDCENGIIAIDIATDTYHKLDAFEVGCTFSRYFNEE